MVNLKDTRDGTAPRDSPRQLFFWSSSASLIPTRAATRKPHGKMNVISVPSLRHNAELFTRREARRFGESDQDLGLRPCQDRGGREG